MSIFKDALKKLQDLRASTADDDTELLEDGVEGEDYTMEKSSTSADSIFGDDSSSNDSWFKYSPTSALENSGMPKVTPFTSSAPTAAPFGEKTAPTAPASSSAATPKLFDLNAGKKSKFKLSFITLQDMYDAKNVANLMMDNDTIVVVNIDNLSLRDKRRAMDFLDGAKYVAKSVHVQFTKTMYAYIPEDIELHGDFCDQVEIAGFDDTQF